MRAALEARSSENFLAAVRQEEAEGNTANSKAIEQEWEGVLIDSTLTMSIDDFVKMLCMNEFLDPSTISQEWQTDAHIDETLLDESSMKIPSLHSKYLDCLAMIR